MERIKQALEKARLERSKMGAAPEFIAPGSTGFSESIAYTQTRTVETDKELLHKKRVVLGIDNNSYTEAYKILRTQVFQRLRDNNWNSLAITSPGISEGKTLTAINLAISLAMEVNYSVLLVDANLRHPSIHSYFGLDAERGLGDYLTGNIPLSEVLVHPADIPRFVMLPGGKPVTNSSELLNSPKLARLVEEMKARYPSRIILFDLPPLLNAADTLAFSPYVDAALLVIEEGKTRTQDLRHAVSLLQNTTILGTVLNKSLANSEPAGIDSKWLDSLSTRCRFYAATLKNKITFLQRRRP